MNVTINGQPVVQDPPIAMMKVVRALLSPTDEDLLVPLQDRIDAFEVVCKDQPQVDIPVKHQFLAGLYRREITFPQDFVGCGKIHLLGHMDEMLTGEMLVATETGIKHLVAPCSLMTLPGGRKFGVALKPTRWVSFHATEHTTVEAVEASLTTDSWEDIAITAEYEEVTTSKGLL